MAGSAMPTPSASTSAGRYVSRKVAQERALLSTAGVCAATRGAVRTSGANAIDAGRGVVEHGRPLRGGVALGQPLEGVVHDVVRVRDLIDREIALEHRPAGAELLD